MLYALWRCLPNALNNDQFICGWARLRPSACIISKGAIEVKSMNAACINPCNTKALSKTANVVYLSCIFRASPKVTQQCSISRNSCEIATASVRRGSAMAKIAQGAT